jgi:hypothetical protein
VRLQLQVGPARDAAQLSRERREQFQQVFRTIRNLQRVECEPCFLECIAPPCPILAEPVGVFDAGLRVEAEIGKKRGKVRRPEADRVVLEGGAPAIVPRELWDAAQTRYGTRRFASGCPWHRPYLLSSLIECASGRLSDMLSQEPEIAAPEVQTRLVDTRRRIDRLVEALTAGSEPLPSVRAALVGLERERERLAGCGKTRH